MGDVPKPPFYPLTEDNRAALVVVAALIFLIYALVGLVLKLLIRLNITSMKDFDVILLAGTGIYIAQTACVIVACNNGLGQHQDSLTDTQFEAYSKSMYSSRILALAVLGCSKISVCLLIWQINSHGMLRIANLVLGGLIIAWVVSGVLATIFQCPLPEPWLAVSSGQCPSMEPVYVFNGVMNILTDVALCVLPVAMMWDVQTSANKKLIVTGLFGTRIIVPILTIPSLSSAAPLFDEFSDSTWLSVSSTIWFQISLGLSILTACIPSLKGVIDTLLGGTAAAAMNTPYELRDTTSGNKSGFTITRLTDSKQASGGGSSGRRGANSSKRKSSATPLATWDDVEHVTSASRIRDKSPGGSDSVRKLTEGVVVVRDEIEVHYETRKGASSSGSHSRESSEVGSYRA